MAKSANPGNITVRKRVSDAVKSEDKFVKSKKAQGWSSGEARRVHRANNARAVAKLRASGTRG